MQLVYEMGIHRLAKFLWTVIKFVSAICFLNSSESFVQVSEDIGLVYIMFEKVSARPKRTI